LAHLGGADHLHDGVQIHVRTVRVR
jgi:hypothetical protein